MINIKKISFGYNFRLTNIQAALGVAQLEQLPVFLKRKHEIFSQYQSAFDNIAGLTLAGVPEYADNNHWMNLLQIDEEAYGEDREELMQRLDENGIQTRPVWGLNHLQKPYQDCQNYKIERMPRKSFPYDLKATKENIELHVEVKGKSDTGEKVIVSRNEVKHSKENAQNSVFILVHSIKANLTAKGYKASGGKLVVKNPWALDDNDLDSYTYEYFVKDK